MPRVNAAHYITACLAAALSMLLISCSKPGPLPAPSKPAQEAPAALSGEIEMPLINEAGGNLVFSDIKASAILIEFWASYVPPCREEGPALEELFKEFKPHGLEVVGFNLDKGPDQDLQAFVRSHRPAPYPQVKTSPEILEYFGGIRPLPTKMLLNADAEVLRTYEGALPLEDIKADIQAVLSGNPLPKRG